LVLSAQKGNRRGGPGLGKWRVRFREGGAGARECRGSLVFCSWSRRGRRLPLGSLFLAPREGSSRLALEMGLGFFIFRVFCV